MSDHQLARIEARLERLIESGFAQFFSRGLRAQDIVLHLSRAITGNIQFGDEGDPRLFAPDRFRIHLNPAIREELLKRIPDLESILSRHAVALASEAGYRLRTVPQVQLLSDEKLAAAGIEVVAEHRALLNGRTAKLDPFSPSPPSEQPRTAHNPQLVINGETTHYLTDAILNAGRSRDNQIVLNDPRVSRHHAQFRLRGGIYWVFDSGSQGGTYVNNVAVREHALQPGDVVRIGKTHLVYLEDETAEQDTGGTVPFSA